MSTRKEKIEAMLADDPRDVFLLYALAMEQRSEGLTEQAIAGFADLTKQQPPYVPAFFMAAQVLVDEDKIAAARTFLRDGIEEARRQGDAHAAGEMSDYLQMLGSEGE